MTHECTLFGMILFFENRRFCSHFQPYFSCYLENELMNSRKCSSRSSQVQFLFYDHAIASTTRVIICTILITDLTSTFSATVLSPFYESGIPICPDNSVIQPKNKQEKIVKVCLYSSYIMQNSIHFDDFFHRKFTSLIRVKNLPGAIDVSLGIFRIFA